MNILETAYNLPETGLDATTPIGVAAVVIVVGVALAWYAERKQAAVQRKIADRAAARRALGREYGE